MESIQSLTANISEKQKYQEEMNNFFRKVIKEQQETNEKLTNMQKETNEKLTNMNEKLTEMLQKIGNRLEIQEKWSKEAHEWFQKNK